MIYILIILLAFILVFVYCCLKISSICELKDKLGIKSPSKELENISDSFRAVALPLCGDYNVNYFLQKMDNLEIDNKHQKKIIDRLSRKIQKLRAEINRLEQLKPNSVVISSDGIKLFVGDKEVISILENQDILNLNDNSINQKVTFHGGTYIIKNLILKQQIGCVDELQIIAHDIFGDLYDKK